MPCNTAIRAHHADLVDHAQGKKHEKNMNALPGSNNNQTTLMSHGKAKKFRVNKCDYFLLYISQFLFLSRI